MFPIPLLCILHTGLPRRATSCCIFNLKSLISATFAISPAQVTGGQRWMSAETYDIDVKPSDADAAAIRTLLSCEILGNRLVLLDAIRSGGSAVSDDRL